MKYEEKLKRILEIIEKLIDTKDKVTKPFLYLTVLRAFGVGQRAVDNLLKILEDNGIIEIKDDLVIKLDT